ESIRHSVELKHPRPQNQTLRTGRDYHGLGCIEAQYIESAAYHAAAVVPIDHPTGAERTSGANNTPHALTKLVATHTQKAGEEEISTYDRDHPSAACRRPHHDLRTGQ